MMRRTIAAAALIALAGAATAQDGPGDPAAAESQDGRYFDAAGAPTYHIGGDGTVDFPTYSGFRRYSAECHVCHGPDGMGSSYAPALIESVTTMGYYDFYDVVVQGRVHGTGGGGQNVMPAFGTNPNVMCYLDDIYVYLRARGQGELPRGRPAKKEDKSDAFAANEDSCMG